MAPELIMLWAMRQRHKAENVAKRFREYGWTKAHGFLTIMKGIALYDGEEFCCYVEDNVCTEEQQDFIKKIEAILERNRQFLRHGGVPHGIRAPENSNVDSNTEEPRDARRIGVIGGTIQSGTTIAPSPCIGRHPGDAAPGESRQPETLRLVLDSQSSGVETALPGNSSVRDALAVRQNQIYEHGVASSLTLDRTRSSCSTVDFGTSDSRPISGSRQELLGEQTSKDETLLEYLLRNGLLRIDEPEINGTFNHGDSFSKLIAVLQNAWFLSKLVGRAAKGLFITELEVIALGSAFLCLVVYVCWWDKPQRVRYPYKVLMPKLASIPTPDASNVRGRTTLQKVWSEYRTISDRIHGDYQRIRREFNSTLHTSLFVPVYPLYFISAQVGALISADKAQTISKVPDYLFSCGMDANSTPATIYLSLCGISVVFGALHFVRWFSTALPYVPQLVWRISTVLVTVLPVLLAFSQRIRPRPDDPKNVPELTSQLLFGFSLWLYVAGRYALVFLALWAMGNLPESAFHDVNWGLGFLHVG
ncbi:hypothetical protein V5O48_018579 [Marasmius crinis-equi]|uniref:Uncharacterized protein n=1 Tax=Marasmius crinis-equi TaxID=585013 RepID=A0ABR3EKT6_9AGAR